MAKRRLNEHGQSKPFNKRAMSPDKYIAYLRALDANQAGASLADAAAILLPDMANSYPDKPAEKRLRANLKAAVQLRDRDYIYLPQMAT
jgi:hypothetical protein